ncbi:lysophospholipid acyltransferase family protein [Hydrogenothermus marinus]|uniref:KDO2-lipid IV(A) lauroyltransferase n=1 Tax=Hydrogenothermus marinus TaxID=133270 RepID=A0A3M0BKM2_9AQUI|nr:lysophospholipid acyltransferase family protein [Hydrogenothermus marinus]RMA97781.1 KDO2-lipid IV(A) lauroyltransferase [Hydrogenothermus marinus]
MSYLLAKSFFSIVSKLERDKNLKIGESIGSLFWNLGYRKKVILKNLDIAFPEKTLDWKLNIGKKSLQNLGRVLTEFPKIPEYIKTGYIEEIFEIKKGKELLEKEEGKILVSAHIGNWELAGAGLSYNIEGMVSLAYRMKNKKLNDLITKIRQDSGIKIIFHNQPLKDFLKALKEKKTISFLVDQNTLTHRGIFVDFFGLEASTVTFPAKLALKFNKDIIFGYSYYDKNTKKVFLELENIDFEKTGDYEKDLKNLVQAYTKKVEKAVKKHPEQYFWTHKRWKTRPKGEPENIYK